MEQFEGGEERAIPLPKKQELTILAQQNLYVVLTDYLLLI